jgi:hypothetical protein
MVEYRLEAAHPAYRPAIRDILDELCRRYPGVDLAAVDLYEPEIGDTSMADADENFVIWLNAHWFARPPEILQRAADEALHMPLGNCRWLQFHPLHDDILLDVLAHEYGHVVALSHPAVLDWAEAAWLAATEEPELAPCGYALANGMADEDDGSVASEFWAEAFAAFELGLAPSTMARQIAELVAPMTAGPEKDKPTAA